MDNDHPKRRAIGQVLIGSGAGLILLCAVLGLMIGVLIFNGSDVSPLAGVAFGGIVSLPFCLGPPGLLGLLLIMAGAALWVASAP